MSEYVLPTSENHLFSGEYKHYRCEDKKCDNMDGVHVMLKTEVIEKDEIPDIIEKIGNVIENTELAAEMLADVENLDEIVELKKKRADLEYQIQCVDQQITGMKKEMGADQLEIEINEGVEYIDTHAREIPTEKWTKSKIGKNTYEIIVNTEKKVFLTRADNSKRKIRAKDMIDKFPFVVQKMADEGMITIPIEKATMWLKKDKIDPKELNALMDTNIKSTYGYVIKDGRNIPK